MFWIFIKINCLTFFEFSIFLIGGSNQIFLIIHQFFSHISICWAFSVILIYHIFVFSTILHQGQGNWPFSKTINQIYPLQHWRNLFYHLQLLIHHLQVIRHRHIYCLDLIINTLLPIRIRSTPQIQMTSTHV